MNICVFGSSSEQIDKIYLESAEHLGKKIAEKGYNLVFGAVATQSELHPIFLLMWVLFLTNAPNLL